MPWASRDMSPQEPTAMLPVYLWAVQPRETQPGRFDSFLHGDPGEYLPNVFGGQLDLAPGECVEVRLVRVEPQTRTPSTGLPPVCDGAAAMKIDPPGSVASPHAVVDHPGAVALLAMQDDLRRSLNPSVSTADFLPQDRPIPAIRLARLIADLADEQDDEAMSWTDGLRLLAERIAHPLRLGDHG